MDLRNLIWIFFLLASLQPVVQRGRSLVDVAERPGRHDDQTLRTRRTLMDLYPQPRGREAAVEYVPARPGERAPSRYGPGRRRPITALRR